MQFFVFAFNCTYLCCHRGLMCYLAPMFHLNILIMSVLINVREWVKQELGKLVLAFKSFYNLP